jgi:hypothetical protein
MACWKRFPVRISADESSSAAFYFKQSGVRIWRFSSWA